MHSPAEARFFKRRCKSNPLTSVSETPKEMGLEVQWVNTQRDKPSSRLDKIHARQGPKGGTGGKRLFEDSSWSPTQVVPSIAGRDYMISACELLLRTRCCHCLKP